MSGPERTTNIGQRPSPILLTLVDQERHHPLAPLLMKVISQRLSIILASNAQNLPCLFLLARLQDASIRHLRLSRLPSFEINSHYHGARQEWPDPGLPGYGDGVDSPPNDVRAPRWSLSSTHLKGALHGQVYLEFGRCHAGRARFGEKTHFRITDYGDTLLNPCLHACASLRECTERVVLAVFQGPRTAANRTPTLTETIAF